jgi:hypothetical protein
MLNHCHYYHFVYHPANGKVFVIHSKLVNVAMFTRVAALINA